MSSNRAWLLKAARGSAGKIAAIGGASFALHDVMKILESNPAKAMEILERWGPAFVIVFFLVYQLGRTLDRASVIAAQNAEAQRQSAMAQMRTADALTALATRDDVAEQRNQLLIEYAANETKKLADSAGLNTHALDRIESRQASIYVALQRAGIQLPPTEQDSTPR